TDPHPDLPYAANYLYMMLGEIPKPEYARAVEQYLISTIDHGFNASTFTARVITSTGADLGAAVVGAIGALSGPLHGGAPSRALDMLDAIGRPENADAHIRGVVEQGGRIMGFGHRVYKTDDPRSLMLRQVALDLGGPLADFARTVEQTVVDVLSELKPGRSLYTNVEFYAGVVMSECGIPRSLFTPTFASRPRGGIVGNLTLVLFRIPPGMRAWIEDVVVDDGARGRGVGEALNEEAIRRAAAAGARSVDLTSRPSREAANRLYRRLGF